MFSRIVFDVSVSGSVDLELNPDFRVYNIELVSRSSNFYLCKWKINGFTPNLDSNHIYYARELFNDNNDILPCVMTYQYDAVNKLSVCQYKSYVDITSKKVAWQNIPGASDSDVNTFTQYHYVVFSTSIDDVMDNLAKIELEYIRSVKHVIGRTSWDKAHVRAINPDANYYVCNETLRDEFYKHSWNYDSCEKHSIFSSQAGYPIKGLHQLLKAMPIILRKYPDTKLYVAGDNLTKRKWYRISGYAAYIRLLIKKYRLDKAVIFTGILSEKEMCHRYLKSNVFVCPSAIENSPNSIGEAQLLGVPCVASYVGGVPDMMRGCEDNMYRFEEVEMLADKIISIFDNPSTISMGTHSALCRHNPRENAERLLSIYQNIIIL